MISMSKMRDDQRGMVSILVTMIMIIVITLIVLGFAQVTRRNERESLDDQLSTQAYYAAESGVNEAVNYLTNPKYIGTPFNTMNNCTSFIGTLSAVGVSNDLNAPTDSTKYTCLMVNTEPNTLTVSPLTQGSNTILYMANTDNEPFTTLNFQWAQQSNPSFGASTCSGSGASGKALPTLSSWDCPYGLFRLDLVDATNISNASLESNQDVMSFYLIPSYRTGSPFMKATTINWAPETAAACSSDTSRCPVQILPISCTANGGCSLQMTIKGGSTEYFARLSMMYQDSSSIIVAGGDATHPYVAAAGAGVSFAGGQALIDSTGQSEDELRRIQVRIPLETLSSTLPANALQTTDSICKQLTDGPNVPFQDICPGHP
jgi:Tfp pilus assembly protein PilX